MCHVRTFFPSVQSPKVLEARVISCLYHRLDYATPPHITKDISNSSGVLEQRLLCYFNVVQPYILSLTRFCFIALTSYHCFTSMSAGSIFLGHLPVVVRLVAVEHRFPSPGCFSLSGCDFDVTGLSNKARSCAYCAGFRPKSTVAHSDAQKVSTHWQT